jgi:hypothetical protein
MARTAADEHRSVARVFTDRVRGTDPEAWDNPAPCEGWAARDVVRHLVEWFPAFLKRHVQPSARGTDVLRREHRLEQHQQVQVHVR